MNTQTVNTVKPITINLVTEEEQARHFFNREFQCTDIDLLKDEGGEPLEIMDPSEEIIQKEMINDYGYIFEDDFKEEHPEVDPDENSDLFWEFIKERDSYDDYYWEWKDGNYPMWNTVFKCDSFYVDSEFCNVDKLYELGINAIDHETGYYLCIAGCGYSFYDAHWIPLFKMLGWIEIA